MADVCVCVFVRACCSAGKEWSESLPSDAEILMNVFCCMMDNMLPADNERDRPFWKSYFLGKGPRRPFTPSIRSRLFVVRTVGRPPHFKILAKAAVREIVPVRCVCVCDGCDHSRLTRVRHRCVVQGEDNLFHAIVVYLHALKRMKAVRSRVWCTALWLGVGADGSLVTRATSRASICTRSSRWCSMSASSTARVVHTRQNTNSEVIATLAFVST